MSARLFFPYVTRGYHFDPQFRIGQIDSRAWDPDWEHRRSFRVMQNLYWLLYRNRNYANTAASAESYWWGWRGGMPSIHLPKFHNMTARQIAQRFMRLHILLRRAFTQPSRNRNGAQDDDPGSDDELAVGLPPA